VIQKNLRCNNVIETNPFASLEHAKIDDNNNSYYKCDKGYFSYMMDNPAFAGIEKD